MASACFRRHIPNPGVEVIVLSENRNTHDDVVETVKLATARGMTAVTLITVAVHVPRTREFLSRIATPLPVRVFAAEEFLRRRYSRRPLCLRTIEALPDSPAFLRTAVREQSGIDALRAGTYDSPKGRR